MDIGRGARVADSAPSAPSAGPRPRRASTEPSHVRPGLRIQGHGRRSPFDSLAWRHRDDGGIQPWRAGLNSPNTDRHPHARPYADSSGASASLIAVDKADRVGQIRQQSRTSMARHATPIRTSSDLGTRRSRFILRVPFARTDPSTSPTAPSRGAFPSTARSRSQRYSRLGHPPTHEHVATAQTRSLRFAANCSFRLARPFATEPRTVAGSLRAHAR